MGRTDSSSIPDEIDVDGCPAELRLLLPPVLDEGGSCKAGD